MKKVSMVLLFALVTIISYGQDRVNRTKLTFSESSASLTSVVGWKYNETLGEWIDYQNVISNDKDYKTKYTSLQGSYMMSKAENTFNNIQTKTLIYNNKKFYVIIWNRWRGSYEYPAIERDWSEHPYTIGYILEESEFNNLKNYQEPRIYSIVDYNQKYESYNETKFLDLIQTKLSTSTEKRDYKWILPIKLNNNKVRFLEPTIETLLRNTTKSKYWTPIYDFDKEYFETDKDNFSKILTIK